MVLVAVSPQLEKKKKKIGSELSPMVLLLFTERSPVLMISEKRLNVGSMLETPRE